jgi:serine/threonine protein phosphatase PrpC
MNLARALNEIACYGDSRCTNSTNGAKHAPHPALVRDDVYVPSDEAARLLPPDGYRVGERIVWDLTALGGDRRSRDR